MTDINEIINILRKTPIDQVFMESVQQSTYWREDGTFDHAQLIFDVWNSALDNVEVMSIGDKTDGGQQTLV